MDTSTQVQRPQRRRGTNKEFYVQFRPLRDWIDRICFYNSKDDFFGKQYATFKLLGLLAKRVGDPDARLCATHGEIFSHKAGFYGKVVVEGEAVNFLYRREPGGTTETVPVGLLADYNFVRWLARGLRSTAGFCRACSKWFTGWSEGDACTLCGGRDVLNPDQAARLPEAAPLQCGICQKETEKGVLVILEQFQVATRLCSECWAKERFAMHKRAEDRKYKITPHVVN